MDDNNRGHENNAEKTQQREVLKRQYVVFASFLSRSGSSSLL